MPSITDMEGMKLIK